MGGVFSSCVFFFQHKKLPFQQKFDLKYLLVCGTLFVLYMISLYSAIGMSSSRIQLLEIGLINYLWPILTVVFSIRILNQSASKLIYPACACALIGIILVTTQKGTLTISSFLENLLSNPAAYSLALLAAISWALYSNMSRAIGGAQPSGGVVLFMFSTAICLFFLRSFFHENSNWNLHTLLEVAYMSVVATLGYIFWDIGVRKGNFSIVSTTSYLTPLLSTFVACLYLNVIAGPKLWLGCILIILGAYASKKSLLSDGGKAT